MDEPLSRSRSRAGIIAEFNSSARYDAARLTSGWLRWAMRLSSTTSSACLAVAVFSKMAASWDRAVQSFTPNLREASSTDAARAMSCARRASAGVSLKYSSSRRTAGTGKVYRAFLSMPTNARAPFCLRTSAEGSDARELPNPRLARPAVVDTASSFRHDAVARSNVALIGHDRAHPSVGRAQSMTTAHRYSANSSQPATRNTKRKPDIILLPTEHTIRTKRACIPESSAFLSAKLLEKALPLNHYCRFRPMSIAEV